MKNIFKLDSTSNRYRICPNCQKAHMVNHLGKDFCSDKCADTHYNQNRRLKKQALTMIAEKVADEKVAEELPSLLLGGEVQTLTEVDSEWDEKMKANLTLLDRLTLDSKHGSVFSTDDLQAQGLNFNVYSTQGKIHNTPAGIFSSFLIFKNYRAYRTDYNKVLIKKIL